MQGTVEQVACGLPERACPLGWVWVGLKPLEKLEPKEEVQGPQIHFVVQPKDK